MHYNAIMILPLTLTHEHTRILSFLSSHRRQTPRDLMEMVEVFPPSTNLIGRHKDKSYSTNNFIFLSAFPDVPDGVIGTTSERHPQQNLLTGVLKGSRELFKSTKLKKSNGEKGNRQGFKSNNNDLMTSSINRGRRIS